MKNYPHLFSPRHRVKAASLIVIFLLAVAIPVAALLAQRLIELQHKTVSVSTTASQLISVNSHGDTVERPLARPTQKPTATSVTKTRPTATLATNNTGNFTILPPGAILPTEAQCASRIHLSSREPRPDNYAANHRIPAAQQIAGMEAWNASIGYDPRADSLRKQIAGNYTGTTDEILQWTACKWGIDVNIVRAEAVTESYWHQSQKGDLTTAQSQCPPGTWTGSNCYQSYGILQIKYIYNKGEWPMSRDDTAFSAEYMYGVIRACYEGWTTYLSNRTPLPGYPHYHAGDIWGCVGRWFSGGWYDQGAINYINVVKTQYANKIWLKSGF
ncbi:MAG TPA: hypothetical protein VIY29_14035 [Ktedonobacteraceae bacterium]